MTSSEVASAIQTDKVFYNWLKEKPEDEIVGDECLTLSCPISNWLLDTYNVSVHIGNFFDCSTLRVVGEKDNVAIPKWAQQFATTVSEGDVSVAVPVMPNPDTDSYYNQNYNEECEADDEFAIPTDQDYADEYNQGVISYFRSVVYKPTAGGCLKILNDMRDN